MRKLITIVVLVVFSSCFSFAGSNETSLKTGLSAHDHPLDNGFILRVGDKQIDSSVRSRLNKLKKEFEINDYVAKIWFFSKVVGLLY